LLTILDDMVLKEGHQDLSLAEAIGKDDAEDKGKLFLVRLREAFQEHQKLSRETKTLESLLYSLVQGEKDIRVTLIQSCPGRERY